MKAGGDRWTSDGCSEVLFAGSSLTGHGSWCRDRAQVGRGELDGEREDLSWRRIGCGIGAVAVAVAVRSARQFVCSRSRSEWGSLGGRCRDDGGGRSRAFNAVAVALLTGVVNPNVGRPVLEQAGRRLEYRTTASVRILGRDHVDELVQVREILPESRGAPALIQGWLQRV
jgi:hypothetical protein